MVRSEIVSTAFKCVLTSAEHRCREHFSYKGERIYGPHYDVDALVEVCRQKQLDYRGYAKTRVEAETHAALRDRLRRLANCYGYGAAWDSWISEQIEQLKTILAHRETTEEVPAR
jgi:hypothetical protein